MVKSRITMHDDKPSQNWIVHDRPSHIDLLISSRFACTAFLKYILNQTWSEKLTALLEIRLSFHGTLPSTVMKCVSVEVRQTFLASDGKLSFTTDNRMNSSRYGSERLQLVLRFDLSFILMNSVVFNKKKS